MREADCGAESSAGGVSKQHRGEKAQTQDSVARGSSKFKQLLCVATKHCHTNRNCALTSCTLSI